ncbi:MAG: hypothetical protein STSR0002_13130 [Smithella sp.]
MAYSPSKAGIVGMTLPIAREISDYGIRSVSISSWIEKLYHNDCGMRFRSSGKFVGNTAVA